MWEHCGVVRSEKKLDAGLNKIEKLKASIKHLDVRPDSEGYEDLMLAFDLEGSIMAAEATILGAKARKESRGSHQRSDFDTIEKNQNVNYIISLIENGKLNIKSQDLQPISEEFKRLIDNTNGIEDFEGMLLE
jgi:succinate dehydrogenase / fumarate reductase flavoprotein subunit